MSNKEYHVITRHWYRGTSGRVTNAVCTALPEACSEFLDAISMEESGIAIPILASYAFIRKSESEESKGICAMWSGNNIPKDYHVTITLEFKERHHED